MLALVTGGAKGLGAALCLALAKQGYAIALHYQKSRDEAIAIAEECRKEGVQADVIQGSFSSTVETLDFIERYLSLFPKTHLLVNNVGPYVTASAMETPIEEWTHLFQVNVHAPFHLCSCLIPSLIAHRGQIVNVGVCGLKQIRAHAYASAYRLSKQALLGLTLTLAKELAPHHVRVNMISPGQLETSIDLPKDLSKLPMQRAASYEEVARVLTFLVAPESAYLTGQNIEIGGGLAL